MAKGDLLWASGFDNRDVGLFDLTTGNAAFATTAPRTPRSTAYFAPSGVSGSVFSLAASISEFMIGFGFMTNSTAPTAGFMNIFSQNNSNNFNIALNGSGKLRVTRNGTLLATGGTTLAVDTWYWLWLYVLIADSGFYRLYLDDNPEIVGGSNLAASGDTRADAGTNGNLCDRINIGNSASYQIDDMYVFDATGSHANASSDGDDVVSGITATDSDRTIPYLIPTSDGNYAQLTPSTGSSHFALVDEIPPNTTDFNSHATNGNKDSYGMSNLTNAAGVDGVVARAVVQKSDAGAKSGRIILRSSGSDQNGADVALSSGATWTRARWFLAKSPFTSSAWTVSEINAIEEGWEVRA